MTMRRGSQVAVGLPTPIFGMVGRKLRHDCISAQRGPTLRCSRILGGSVNPRNRSSNSTRCGEHIHLSTHPGIGLAGWFGNCFGNCLRRGCRKADARGPAIRRSFVGRAQVNRCRGSASRLSTARQLLTCAPWGWSRPYGSSAVRISDWGNWTATGTVEKGTHRPHRLATHPTRWSSPGRAQGEEAEPAS